MKLPPSIENIILGLITGGIFAAAALPFGILTLYAVGEYSAWAGASQFMLDTISEGASAAVVHVTILIFVAVFVGTVLGLRRRDQSSQSVT